MICPNCGTENTATARYCIQCGQSLPRLCSACGTENPPIARFCNQCGTPLPGAAPTSGPLRAGTTAAAAARAANTNGASSTNGTHSLTPAPGAPSAPVPGVPTQPSPSTPGRRPQIATATLTKPLPGDESTEQRRVVTMLFADLTNSTALADHMDPEDVRAMLGEFFSAMAREIHKHGGTVEKYIGDAIMAVFGLPAAHEDDPIRAVRAALDMQAALQHLNDRRVAADPGAPVLQLRIGINTGEVAAAGRAAGALDGGDFLVTGEPVNVAARLYENASPGAIWVGPRTYRGTTGAVRYRKLAPISVRGKAQPVPVWEVLALTDESPVPSQRPRGVKGLSAPLVGRDAEMELLHALFARVLHERRPHLVTLLGAPGIGKTRLARECTQWFRAAAEPVGETTAPSARLEPMSDGETASSAPVPAAPRPELVILEGRCPTYGEGITYWPLAEMLRAYCHFTALEPPESARAKLLTHVQAALEAVGRTDEPEVIAALLGHTIGIETAERRKRLLPSDGTQLQEAMLRAWRTFFEAVAAPAGLVVWVEDIHSADDLLLDLLEYVAARASGVPLLVLCTARPELLERRGDWGGGKRNYALIQLDALSQSSARTLLAALLPGDQIPETLRAGIIEKADGNPFYVEEILHMLVDRGILEQESSGGWRVAPECENSVELADPVIPDTVQGVLLARLDLLPADERDLLQHAAVLGRYFWASALRRLAGHIEAAALDELLQALQNKDLILVSEHAKHSIAIVDEPIYRFSHPLVREVTYATIARSRRAREHARVAEILEDLARGREAELAELLALHYQQYYRQAGLARSRNAARREAVRDKVLLYLTLAGDQAAARQAAAKAEQFYSDAISLLEADDEGKAGEVPRRVELYAKRGDARWLAVRADDAWRDYRHALDLWFAYGAFAQPPEGSVPVDGQAGRARELVDAPPGTPTADGALGEDGTSAVAGMMPEAWRAQGLRLCRLLVQLATRDRGLFQQPPNHDTLLPLLKQGLRLAQELEQHETPEYAGLLTARAFFWWSWPERRGERELLEALRSAREAVRIMEALDDPRGASEALDALGNIQAATTDLRGYLESQRQRLRWAERIDVARELVDIHSELSLANQLVGEFAPAVEHAATALEIANEADSDVLRAQALRSAVLAHVEADAWDEALRLGAELVAYAARAKVTYSDRHIWALLALATAATRAGRRDEAESFIHRVAICPTPKDAEPQQFVELYRARLALARGAAREGRRILVAALARRAGRQSLAAMLAELAELGARGANAQFYERFGAQALELGWRSGARKALAQATRARAVVALRERRWDDALCEGETALLSFQSLGTPWEAARTRYVLAGVYLRRAAPGDDELARGELTRALDAFERLHAVRELARAKEALASSDVRLP
jgi:class 3 adenylate cyclase